MAMDFSGRLASFPMPELMSWMCNDRRSGALVVRRTSREKRIYFLHGQVVACLTDDPAEFYGQHLLLNGFIDRSALFHCLTICKEEERRLSTVLVEQEMLDPAIIQATLRRQVEEAILDVFLWPRGVFFVQAELPPQEEVLEDPLDPVGLALEGSRWIDEYARLRQLFAHDNITLRLGEMALQEAPPLEDRIVAEVDGERTLESLYAVVKGSYFRFLEAAAGLVRAGVLAISDVGEKLQLTSLELPLHDLLLEQATDERSRLYRRHFVIALEVLDRYVPVWVGEPDADAWARLPEEEREFYRRFDGSERLSDVFSGDPERRSREMELLLVQLRQEAIALLPAPLTELDFVADRRRSSKPRWWRRAPTPSRPSA